MTRPHRHAPRSVYMMERARRAQVVARYSLAIASAALALSFVAVFGSLV